MDEELWQEVAVLGAAGKMGRGIALLLLQEMARGEAEKRGAVGKRKLYLIDNQEDAFYELRPYFKAQLTLFAERQIVSLREYYAHDPKLISNGEIIAAFVEGALNLIHFDTEISKAKNCRLIFEAIFEEVETKLTLYRALKKQGSSNCYYFSNTSSIPISLINEKAQLDNHIIGFHFYNPPPIQKLVELITYKEIDPLLVTTAKEIAQRLKKVVVQARDVAGFIGNGHFLREVLFAHALVQELGKLQPRTAAIYLVNKVSRDYLMRPMGIFQLMDYVGIDVCLNIAHIMQTYLKTPMPLPLLEELHKAGIKGGLNNDSSLREGFFRYDRSGPIAIYSFEEKKYKPLQEMGITALEATLGPLPEKTLPWKALVKDENKEEKIQAYLQNLVNLETPGAKLAKRFLENSQQISQQLVQDGVAKNSEEVSKVLENGFYHLYGPEILSLQKATQK